MVNKRGQITVFIVIGIIILALFFLFSFLSRSKQEKLDIEFKEIYNLQFEKQSINDFVESCIKQTTIYGSYLLGSQGGYIYQNDKTLYAADSETAYHYYKGKPIIPIKEKMEDEISFFIKTTINFCLDNLNSLGNEVIFGELNVSTVINDEDIRIDLNYPVTVTKEDKQIKIERFNVNIPCRLGHIVDIGENLVEEQSTNKEFIDFDYLTSIDLKITLLPYDEETIVYSILDEKYIINEAPFVYSFAYTIYTSFI